MTWKDEIVDEIRKIRDEHARKFNYDIEAICRDLREQEKNCRQIVIPPPDHPKIEAK